MKNNIDFFFGSLQKVMNEKKEKERCLGGL